MEPYSRVKGIESIKLNGENSVRGGPYLPHSTLQFFLPIIFYHVPPIFLDSESICFGAPTLLSPTFVDDGKYVLSNKLHSMGRIYKKLLLWDFLIKFSFGCLQNLTPDNY